MSENALIAINVYDLTGRKRIRRYIAHDDTDIKAVDQNNFFDIHDLLIYPREKYSNKSPYCQDYKNPIIEDFEMNDGHFYYDNSYFLDDILHLIEIKNDRTAFEDLKKFFDYENQTFEAFTSDKDFPTGETNKNIILVPDHYLPLMQENLLSACGLRRSESLLLWRSVAACLGAEELLKEKGATEGDRVAVLDIQEKEVSVSVLTLKKDQGYLVPKRRFYEEKSKSYPANFPMERFSFRLKNDMDEWIYDEDLIEFVKHTSGRFQKEICVPNKRTGKWQEIKVFTLYNSMAISQRIDADFFIITGDNNRLTFSIPQMNENNTLDERTLKSPAGNRYNFISTGAARFCVRKELGKPTYFDECQPLSLIVADKETEEIRPHTLIEGNDECRGGETIEGEAVEDVSILQGSNSGEFYLCLGEPTNFAPLKFLKQQFTEELAEVSQKLIIYPSMIPGQGIAIVDVECNPKKDEAPLFESSVRLDWLQMEDSKETIQSLAENTKHSFPPDVPDIEADNEKWRSVKFEVICFIKGERIDSGVFSKAQWINPYARRLKEQLQRKNVFGTAPNRRLPLFEDKEIFDRLFSRIKEEYDRSPNDDIIRLAAWTYQRDNPIFNEMKQDVLKEVKRASKYFTTVSPQYFTFIANFLYQEENLTDFFYMFLNRMNRSLDTPMHWCRALGDLLMLNNLMLKNIPTYDCQQCMKLLIQIYEQNCQRDQLPKPVLKAILFLLRRRRFDKNFCKKNSSDEEDRSLYEKLEEIGDDNSLFLTHTSKLRKAVKDYLIGNGSTLPVADLS